MPDPRLMSALMLWTSFNTLRKGHVDSRKVFLNGTLLVFLNGRTLRCSCCRIRKKNHGKVVFAYVLKLGKFQVAGLGAL